VSIWNQGISGVARIGRPKIIQCIVILTIATALVGVYTAPVMGATGRLINRLDMVNFIYGGAWSDSDVRSHWGDFPVLIVSNWIDKGTLGAIRAGHSKAVAYVTFYQLSPDFEYQGVNAAYHPEWWCRNMDGSWRASVFSNSYEPGFITMCPNDPYFRKYCAKYARYLMDRGFDGLFVDNCDPDMTCFGDVIGAHPHVYPGKSNDYAFRSLLKEIRALVKSYGDDKLFIANAGNFDTRWVGVCDAQMQESYIYSSCSPAPKWPEQRSIDLMRRWSAAAASGQSPSIATSYLKPQHTRADAFYAYAWARVSGFIWCDGWSAKNTASDLYTLRLGASLEPPREYPTYWKRSYEKGIVVVTRSSRSSSVAVPLPSGRKFYDAYRRTNLTTPQRGSSYVRIPTGSGRVFCSR
jgi:hypothetical protein